VRDLIITAEDIRAQYPAGCDSAGQIGKLRRQKGRPQEEKKSRAISKPFIDGSKQETSEATPQIRKLITHH
jgi:hypothetical protein